jgi:hypothetical protein
MNWLEARKVVFHHREIGYMDANEFKNYYEPKETVDMIRLDQTVLAG